MSHSAGIVLCGGRSSRMGRPKAWLPFGDEVLLQRVVRILSEVVHPIVVVAAPDQTLPELPRQTLIVRDEREYLGPLNGLAEGLAALPGRAESAYLSSCDVPFLRPEFVRRVMERLGEASVCMPEVGGYKHPLAAAYRVDVLPMVRRLLAENRLRPAFLTDLVPTCILRETDFVDVDPDLLSLRNMNTPEEYEAALRDAGQAPADPD
jgi:molybdopterin-guanine dinucleotide biosynthesis protein A